MDGDSVAADFDGQVAGGFDANGFEAKVLISCVAELVKQALDGLRAVSGVEMRSHECAVGCEERGGVIVVASVERGYEILSEIADQGLDIHERTRVRHGIRIGPVHLLPPGGRPRAKSAARVDSCSTVQRHSSARNCGKRTFFWWFFDVAARGDTVEAEGKEWGAASRRSEGGI